jgi:hypothetical protein
MLQATDLRKTYVMGDNVVHALDGVSLRNIRAGWLLGFDDDARVSPQHR